MATQRQKEQVARKVAKALAKVSSLGAGQQFGVDKPQSVAKRAQNLLDSSGQYGAYIVPGDPNEWSGGEPLATIYMEQHGGPGDCVLPLDYYNFGDEDSCKASALLGNYFIEFNNAAVAHVWPV